MVVVYAAHMGLSYDAARWIIARGPGDLNMLTKAEADRLGVAVDIYDVKAAAGPQDGTK